MKEIFRNLSHIIFNDPFSILNYSHSKPFKPIFSVTARCIWFLFSFLHGYFCSIQIYVQWTIMESLSLEGTSGDYQVLTTKFWLPVLYHLPVAQSALPYAYRSLMKMLDSISYSICPWGKPLLTGLKLDFVLLITALWSLQVRIFNLPHYSFIQSILHQVFLWGCCERWY